MKPQLINPLGGYIEERTERLRTDSTTIYSVTNERGFVRSLDLFDKQVFSADTGNYKRVAFQDLAYNPSRINVGSVAMLEDENGGAVSPMYVIVHCKPGLLPRYLLHFLKSEAGINQIRQRCEGAVRFQLKFRDLCAIPIYAPSLAEQERILNLLGEADGLRKLRAGADHRNNALIPALFHEMFGDPKENPFDWPVVTLGDLIVDGPQNGLYKPSNAYGEGTPILRIDAFYDGVVTKLWSELRRLNISAEEIKRYRVNENDILVNRVNSGNHLGKSALLQTIPEPTVFESNMMRFSFDPQRANGAFLIHLLQTTHFRRHVESRAKHAIGQSSINQTDLKLLSVPLPPVALQNEFACRVAEIRKLEASQASSRTHLDTLFQSMLHRAFNGEL